MNLAIAADHAGYWHKEALKSFLEQNGHRVQDFGAFGPETCDYADFAAPVGRSVASGAAERGILICGSGIGMSIAANKIPGIRAAVLFDMTSTRTSRSHNDVNVACLGARTQSLDDMKAYVSVWLTTPFEGGRHVPRLEKVRRLESRQA
jgi:ribose 5-phosphate isomerase B